jgi:hypothetical protein
MIKENRVSKYLLYAIGEIILVVIGILIALQINIWNEERKQKEELKAIYEIIISDLEKDIAEVDQFIIYYEEKRKLAFDTLMRSTPTQEQWDANPLYHNVFNGYEDIAINTRGYELFKGLSTSTMLEDELASSLADFYNDHLIEIKVAQDELGEDLTDNWRHFKKLDWLLGFLLGKSDGLYTYVAANPDAKRRIASYARLYSVYISELERFKKDAEQLTQEVESHLES